MKFGNLDFILPAISGLNCFETQKDSFVFQKYERRKRK